MRRIAGLAESLAVAICLAVGPVVTTKGAVPPCRIRNVTQEISGDSLIRMVKQARDGDRLHVRGTRSGEVVIRADIVVSGVGDRPTLTGRHRSRVVRVEKGSRVILRDLVITRGAGVVNGAGIANDGDLRRSWGVTVQGNRARRRLEGSSGDWRWHREQGRLLLEDSTVRRNEAQRSAGGIFNRDGSVTLRRSTVSHNATIETQYDPDGGGGIENSIRGRL